MCARKKAVAFYFTHTHTQTRSHTLSLVNGIKSLSDNSPDGQTRNQASISPPASFPPYPLNHSLFLTHAHRHLLHTWNYNYKSTFPQQRSNEMAISLANKSNPSEHLDCQTKQNLLKFALLEPRITDISGAERSPRCRPWPRQLSVCFSSPPLLLRAPCYLTT